MWLMVAKEKVSTAGLSQGGIRAGHSGAIGTEALAHLYFLINVAVFPVQLHLCEGLSVACSLALLGSYVMTARSRGQNHVIHQLALWELCLGSSLQRK